MGRILKKVTVSNGRKSVRVRALVDTGADITVLNAVDAAKIGFDVCKGDLSSIQMGTEIAGREFHVTMKVGQRKAALDVFVPTHRRDKDGNYTQLAVGEIPDLLGQDFLQATLAKVNFRTHALEGGDLPSLFDWTRRPLTPHDTRQIRRKCRGLISR